SSPNIMAITTLKDNCYLEINESFTRGTGYTREEIIGKTVNEVNTWANPEDRSRMVSLLRENGRVYNEEFQFLVKSGEVHTMLFSVEEIKIGDEPCLISVSNDITERKRMENAMKESEEKFSKAFASSPEMIAITSVKDARYLDVNESYIRGTGYSREELIGHTTASVGIWKSDDDIKRMARLYREHGRVSNEEFDFRMKSGEIRTWMFSLEPITIGGEQCFIGVAMDITERKRMEQAQRESEEKFAAAFHSSPDMITISNMNKDNYIEVNDSFVRNTGYTREELVGHPVGEINMFANPQESEKMARLLQEQGYIRNEEFSFKIKSGEIRAWLCSADVITIGGEPCTIAVATDITERKQAQQAQRESEEKFAAAFHSSPDMIIITSLTDGKYIDVNESFVQNTGYTREEFIGHTVNEFDLWADPAEAESFLRIFQEQNKVRNQVYRFRCKSGEIRTWLCSADFVTIGGQTRMLAVAADITERKKAEEALQESEEKFSKAFYSSPFSVSISRLGDGAFIDVNDRFLRDKGYTREEIIGHSSKSLNIWANHDQALNIMQTVKGGGQIHNMEAQFLTKSGDVRTGLISADIINIKNEPCMMVINSDITQQKQAEEQLRILSSVTEQVSDSTVITDPDFKINYMNQAAQKLFGYTIEEARGKSLNLFSEKPIAKSMRQEIVDKIASDKVWSGIITKKQKNGNIILCDCHMSPLYDEKGNLVFYIDVQRDVTRQKEIEAKLQEHKKLIDSILATMPEGVLVIDSQDRIVLANKAFYAIFHMPTAMKNKTLGEILPVDSFFDLHKAVKLGIAENNTLEFRYQVQGLDRIIYCIVVKMDGERSLLTFTDVTAEREKEEKLYLTDRLASLGEMAAGLAHELNNPLTGILALSQMLVDSDLPAEHKEDLDCINNEAKRAAGIVRNVLLFARNKSDVNGRSSINEVLTDVVRLREYEQKASNIKVVTELEDNLPEIPIDKGQLQQVFLNLISNAEAAVKEAGRPGVITVTTQRTNGHVNILVSDNGCGIKKDVMPRIFDPFFTTKEIGKGTGLGLSICYSIIVKHGGKINVKSQVNEGTTFTIRMPVVLPER
ncbi:MAG: PAS domain S-box protein, partial [Dehalococcoidales bacterium]